MAAGDLTVKPDAVAAGVGEAVGLLVTGAARHGVVRRQPRVVEQDPSECRPRVGRGVVVGGIVRRRDALGSGALGEVSRQIVVVPVRRLRQNRSRAAGWSSGLRHGGRRGGGDDAGPRRPARAGSAHPRDCTAV